MRPSSVAAAGLAAALVFLTGVETGRRAAPPTGLMARLLDPPPTLIAGVDPTPTLAVCPADALVLLTGGQSNAANALSDPVPADPARPVFMMRDGRCYLSADPVLGATDSGGSLWTALGHRLSDQLGGRAIVFIHGAASGRTFADWRAPDTGLLRRLRAQAEAAAAAGFRADVVLWHQGESDAARHDADSTTLERDLSALIDLLRETLPLAPTARFLLYRASRCAGVHGERRQALTDAQSRVAASRPDVVAGPDTDLIGDWGRHDGCHFNATGRRFIVAETILALTAPAGGRPSP